MGKKLFAGLAILLIGIGSIGCQPTINERVKKIKYHYSQLRELIGLKEDEKYWINSKKGHLNIVIYGKDEIRSTDYLDTNNDGVYDKRETLTIPHKLDVIPLPKGFDNDKYNSLEELEDII